MDHHVFISYDFDDEQIARKIRSKLEERGVQTWMAPDDIHKGEEYDAAIYRAIVSATGLVLVLTPDSNESKHVAAEVNMASNAQKTIFPVSLRKDLTASDALQVYVARPQWTDAWKSPMDSRMDELASAILAQETNTSSVPLITHPTPKKKQLPNALVLGAVIASMLVVCAALFFSPFGQEIFQGAENLPAEIVAKSDSQGSVETGTSPAVEDNPARDSTSEALEHVATISNETATPSPPKAKPKSDVQSDSGAMIESPSGTSPSELDALVLSMELQAGYNSKDNRKKIFKSLVLAFDSDEGSVLKYLNDCFGRNNEALKLNAALIMTQSETPISLPVTEFLIDTMLRHDSAAIRSYSAIEVGRARESSRDSWRPETFERARKGYINLSKYDENRYARSQAIKELIAIGDEESLAVIGPLVESKQGDDEGVSGGWRMALRELTDRGSTQSWALLGTICKSTDLEILGSAIYWLGARNSKLEKLDGQTAENITAGAIRLLKMEGVDEMRVASSVKVLAMLDSATMIQVLKELLEAPSENLAQLICKSLVESISRDDKLAGVIVADSVANQLVRSATDSALKYATARGQSDYYPQRLLTALNAASGN